MSHGHFCHQCFLSFLGLNFFPVSFLQPKNYAHHARPSCSRNGPPTLAPQWCCPLPLPLLLHFITFHALNSIRLPHPYVAEAKLLKITELQCSASKCEFTILKFNYTYWVKKRERKSLHLYSQSPLFKSCFGLF